jgi:hypothetical protein
MPKPSAPNSIASVPRSQLFTVRLWREDLGDGRSEWRGQVQHVLSYETRYFRDWQTLAAFLVEQLEKHSALRGKESGGG